MTKKLQKKIFINCLKINKNINIIYHETLNEGIIK